MVEAIDETSYNILVKAVMTGDAGVGKSSLLHRFIERNWNPHYVATLGADFKQTTLHRSLGTVRLQLWDTAGQERFHTLTPAYYRGAHAIVFVCDVTNQQSLINLMSRYVLEVDKYVGDDVPRILLANKVDLDGQRVVSRGALEAVSKVMRCYYFETSACDDVAVDEAFHRLVDACLVRQSRGGAPSSQHISLFDQRRISNACACIGPRDFQFK